MRVVVATVPLLIALTVGGMAQPAASGGSPGALWGNPPMGTRTGGPPDSPMDSPTGSGYAPGQLSPQGLPESGRPSDFLRAAEGALAAGRLRQTQEALEMAQTRMLDRSVALGRTNRPSSDPVVGQVSDALRALAAGDRAGCMQSIQTALTSTTAQGR